MRVVMILLLKKRDSLQSGRELPPVCGINAAPENELRFGAMFSAKPASFRFTPLGFVNRLLKKSVRDFFDNPGNVYGMLCPVVRRSSRAGRGSKFGNR